MGAPPFSKGSTFTFESFHSTMRSTIKWSYLEFADGPRREKAQFWWHWLYATNDNPEEEWRWTVKGKEIPLSDTTTFWDFEEPSNSKSTMN